MSTTDLDTASSTHLQSSASYNHSQSTLGPSAASDVAPSHKRPASPDPDEGRKDRKRRKGEMDSKNGSGDGRPAAPMPNVIDGQALVDDLSQELQCGCCSGLVYKPVVVVPCDHFFCGSCCTLWVKNGGTNCPACRSVSTAVIPSRPLQAMVDVLLRAAPHLQRTERERLQADDIYPVLRPFRIPVPREASPEPVIPPSSDFIQPCPHCAPNNSFHWTCPQPIADAATDPENAWRVDAGAPPGHGFCGNCEVLLALQAPATSRCDFCQVSFCGINVPSRCVALPISAQNPHGMSDVGDLIQSPEIYECFEGSTVEVDFMLDYVTTQRLSPKQIYRQIAAHIQSQPEGFRPLIEQELFMEMHGVSGGIDPDPSAPRRLICRLCATEVFLYGLRDWWIRERRKAISEGKLAHRRDCPDGPSCGSLGDPVHAKEFNHLTDAGHTDPISQASSSSSSNLPAPSAANGSITPPIASSLFLPPISSESPPTNPAGLPSISNLVAELNRPRFSLPSDLFSRFDSGLEEDQRVEQRTNSAAPPIDLHTRQRDIEEQRNVLSRHDSVEDLHFSEPSSSQSRREVETHLGPNLLTEYGSETGSETEDRREPVGAEADAQFQAYFAPDGDVHNIRRTQSPSKMEHEIDVTMLDTRPAQPPSGSAFAPFHFYPPGVAYSPTGTSTPPISSAYPVPVE